MLSLKTNLAPTATHSSFHHNHQGSSIIPNTSTSTKRMTGLSQEKNTTMTAAAPDQVVVDHAMASVSSVGRLSSSSVSCCDDSSSMMAESVSTTSTSNSHDHCTIPDDENDDAHHHHHHVSQNSSINSNSSNSGSNSNRPLSSLMKRKPTMKSSFALTSMLAQQQEMGSNIINTISGHSSSHHNISSSTRDPLLAGTSLAYAMVADAHAPTATTTTCRTSTALPMPSPPLLPIVSPQDFGRTLQVALEQSTCSTRNNRLRPEDPLNFRDKAALRQTLELSLRHARKMRDSCRSNSVSQLLLTTGSNHHHHNSNHLYQQHSHCSCHPIASTTCCTSPSMPDSSSPSLPLSSWVGLPYASLREERPFLYDHMHTHPLADILCHTLGVADLSQLHQSWDPAVESAKDHQRRIFQPLLDRNHRRAFHHAYESFVTSCCIPLLHASALSKNVFNTCSSRNRASPSALTLNHNNNSASATAANAMDAAANATSSSRSHPHNHQHHPGFADPILYRYQVFPTINVIYPNDPNACVPPTCDLSHGMSVGWLHFHVPLTASVGTSALYCEHFPGKEDWHALRCSSVGLGYCWDGARCLRFSPLNTTGKTRLSLDFRILLVRASSTTTTIPTTTSAMHMTTTTIPNDMTGNNNNNSSGDVDDDVLCRPHHLQDAVSRIPGFYEEATMDMAVLGASKMTSSRYHQRRRYSKGEPDARCGFPFA